MKQTNKQTCLFSMVSHEEIRGREVGCQGELSSEHARVRPLILKAGNTERMWAMAQYRRSKSFKNVGGKFSNVLL